MKSIFVVIALVFLKKTVVKKKKNSRFYMEILKKVFTFSFFFRIFFRKNELWFSVFIRIMKSIFLLTALVFLKKTVVKKKKKSRFYIEILKKTLYFFIFFRIFSRNGNHNSNEKWYELLHIAIIILMKFGTDCCT